jgi:hypothetical protein
MRNSMTQMQVVHGVFPLDRIITVDLLRALSPERKYRVRNIVLVHGAWADGSGWKGVYDILVKDGYNCGSRKRRSH